MSVCIYVNILSGFLTFKLAFSPKSATDKGWLNLQFGWIVHFLHAPAPAPHGCSCMRRCVAPSCSILTSTQSTGSTGVGSCLCVSRRFRRCLRPFAHTYKVSCNGLIENSYIPNPTITILFSTCQLQDYYRTFRFQDLKPRFNSHVRSTLAVFFLL